MSDSRFFSSLLQTTAAEFHTTCTHDKKLTSNYVHTYKLYKLTRTLFGPRGLTLRQNI